MVLIFKEEVFLADGRKYRGYGYYEGGTFIPHGCGKKYFPDCYAYGNFRDGKVDGPAIVSHDHYMNTMLFKNNRGNGWGLCMNRGVLAEFGFYNDSKLAKDLTDFALWYFTKMQNSGRNENMLNVYSFKDSHEVAELHIGYKASGISCAMGFHFMPDGSVWMGNTAGRRFEGNLIHFCGDGTIDCGLFENGKLVERKKLQDLIDDYYGTHSFEDDDLFAEFLGTSTPNTLREQFRDTDEIIPGFNYFSGNTTTQSLRESKHGINKYSMPYHVIEVDFSASGDFCEIDEELWNFGDSTIITSHGILEIEDAIFIEEGRLVGVQFTVNGRLKLSDFRNFNGWNDEPEIRTFALMRQPNNAWLWVYGFDESGTPVVNFCGYDDLDGLANFIPLLKRKYR